MKVVQLPARMSFLDPFLLHKVIFRPVLFEVYKHPPNMQISGC